MSWTDNEYCQFNPMEVKEPPLRIARRQIGRYREDVIVVQMRHDCIHQHVERTFSRSGLEPIELTSDVERGNTDNPGNLAQPSQRFTMTNCALNRFARTGGFYQCLTLCEAAWRHVSDKPTMGIAARRPCRILRHFDDAIADRLRATAGQRKSHAELTDISLGYGVGFDDFHPNPRLEARKPLRSLPGAHF